MNIQPATGIDNSDCVQAVKNLKLPESFTWRTFGGDQIENPGARDQRLCGGCWAFAVASSTGDRIALANQIQAPYPSSAWLISAGINIDTFSGWQPVEGCAGNNVYNAAKWLGDNNVPLKLESCWPFTTISASQLYGGPGQVTMHGEAQEVAPTFLGDSKYKGCCLSCCGSKVADEAAFSFGLLPARSKDNTTIHTKYYGVDNEKLPDGGKYTQEAIDLIIKDIQLNILGDGPVTTSILVYSDFQQFWIKQAKSGAIYTHTPGADQPGGHAVVIVGWGVQDGVKYWEIRNSWGANTGGWEGGYIKIAMSSMANQQSWIGVDVPLYDPRQQAYYCGVVSMLPTPIKKADLDNAVSKGFIKKSAAGNLLAKSRALIGGFDQVIATCPNFKGYTVSAASPDHPGDKPGNMTPKPSPSPTMAKSWLSRHKLAIVLIILALFLAGVLGFVLMNR